MKDENETWLTKIVGSLARPLAALALSAVFIHTALAEDGGDAIDIKIDAFESPTFNVGGGEYRPLKQNSSYHPDFLKLISSDSEANEKLQHAETYSGVTLAGGVVILAGTIVLLQDTLDQKDQLDNNQLPQEDDSKTSQALGLVIVGGVISLIGSSNYRSDVREAVEIYNRNLKAGKLSDASAFRKPKLKAEFSLGVSPPTANMSSSMTVGMNLNF